MKKLFMLVLSVALLSVMAVSAFAAPDPSLVGKIFESSSEGLVITDDPYLIPSKTYYICVVASELNGEKPKDSKAKLNYTNRQIAGIQTGSVSIAPTSLTISKKKMWNNQYSFFAEMPLKEIPISKYHEDGFDFLGTLTFKAHDGTSETIDIDKICNYPDGGTTVYDYQSYYKFSDEDDIVLDVEGTEVKIELSAKGIEYRLLLAMDTTYDEKLSDKYPNAYLDFYNGNGASFKRKATVIIPREGTQYLYEYSGSTLTQITSRNSNGDFEFKTDKLGKYVVSDTKLAATGVVTPTPTPTTTPGLTPPYGGGFFNPGTGACA